MMTEGCFDRAAVSDKPSAAVRAVKITISLLLSAVILVLSAVFLLGETMGSMFSRENISRIIHSVDVLNTSAEEMTDAPVAPIDGAFDLSAFFSTFRFGDMDDGESLLAFFLRRYNAQPGVTPLSAARAEQVIKESTIGDFFDDYLSGVTQSVMYGEALPVITLTRFSQLIEENREIIRSLTGKTPEELELHKLGATVSALSERLNGLLSEEIGDIHAVSGVVRTFQKAFRWVMIALAVGVVIMIGLLLLLNRRAGLLWTAVPLALASLLVLLLPTVAAAIVPRFIVLFPTAVIALTKSVISVALSPCVVVGIIGLIVAVLTAAGYVVWRVWAFRRQIKPIPTEE